MAGFHFPKAKKPHTKTPTGSAITSNIQSVQRAQNVAGLKRYQVYILKIEKPELFKALLKKTLKTKIVVDKAKEIYQRKMKLLIRLEAPQTFNEAEHLCAVKLT